MSDRHPCPECTAEYTSQLGAEECGEQDRAEDLHARQAIRGRGSATKRTRP